CAELLPGWWEPALSELGPLPVPPTAAPMMPIRRRTTNAAPRPTPTFARRDCRCHHDGWSADGYSAYGYCGVADQVGSAGGCPYGGCCGGGAAGGWCWGWPRGRIGRRGVLP